ncbi:hypothetical protein BW686_20970 [Pseudomonas syringae]|uniref:Uncharacterized protein n=1 Tax=Pseudomonas syringae TaxID=317 RepID=A0A244ELM7_PSESX|nr:hypothetical protein BW686_20970 [Pseudomonas syringae]
MEWFSHGSKMWSFIRSVTMAMSGAFACMEMGLAIATALSMTQPLSLEADIRSLQALNDQKNVLEDLTRQKHV